MADVDGDLIGIIVACAVCAFFACVLVILAGVYCHRRLERKRREAAKSSHEARSPYLVPIDQYMSPVPHLSHPNSVHESVDRLSAYRPKILTPHPDGMPEAEYQELGEAQLEMANGHASPVGDPGSPERRPAVDGEQDLPPRNGGVQYVYAHRQHKGVVMTAVEPYRIVEPVPIIPYAVHTRNSSTPAHSMKSQKRHSQQQQEEKSSPPTAGANQEPQSSETDRVTGDRVTTVVTTATTRTTTQEEDKVDVGVIPYDAQAEVQAEKTAQGKVEHKTIISTTHLVQSSESAAHQTESSSHAEHRTTQEVVKEPGNTVMVSSYTGPEGVKASSDRIEAAITSHSIQQATSSAQESAAERTENRDVFVTRESHLASWKIRTYEEKDNSVDFESEVDIIQDEIPNGATAGLVSMPVRDYSFMEGNGDGSSTSRKTTTRHDDYTVLDYVDPDSTSANARQHFKSVMGEIESRHGHGLPESTTSRDEVNASADKVPPVFTSTPRAPPDVTHLEHDVNNRQRNEHEGSIEYPPDKN